MNDTPVISYSALAPGASRSGGLEAVADRARARMKRQASERESNDDFDEITSFEHQVNKYESNEALAPKSTEAKAEALLTEADLIKSEKPGFWNAVKRRMSRGDHKS
ncbi:uncharacterized protein N7511_001830 [Penicillium nucicola]|uniref:uncharacterized protein n=1 Tax=Penicillium nucicola TaxID=1850975 RepID=UPI002544E35D|nr:uncharacterized protein N7511_001830 [Penicillium nucicola]KAJ5769779.1 hypothetical protein N7511_001830 [Penicillium nucicola]